MDALLQKLDAADWCAVWVHLADLVRDRGEKRPASPFRDAVNLAVGKLLEKGLKVP